MFDTLPPTAQEFMAWDWARIEPYYQNLAERPLSSENVAAWLTDWSQLARLVGETFARLRVAVTSDTTDQAAEQRYNRFSEQIYPYVESAEQQLKQKLLASGLEPRGFDIPLRNMRAQTSLFSEANLPLFIEERRLGSQYNKLAGAQTVEWEGREVTLTQLRRVFHTAERPTREQAWRLAAQRQLADRPALNSLWQRLLGLRRQLAANAGYADYRAFRWQQTLRFDYTPADCARFRAAIEQVVVPAASRIYARRRQRLGVASLRPWDLEQDVYLPAHPPLQPFQTVEQLERTGARIFQRVDPVLGDYFETMRRERLLDLENRKGKGPGAYCTSFDAARRPFIFMNAVGLEGDVRTLLHEAGHAFHVFESSHLPYAQQLTVGMEFAEVASMSMELLASPYLAASEGGFYSPAEAARARVQHLEHIMLFWPYMAIVDGFQHWAYENPDAAADPARCDAQWAALWQRFIPAVDWSGLEESLATGWHRKLHIFRYPFYYVEYGLAQLGAVQVWRNALSDQQAAVKRYRQALALGGTVSLPELYRAAGARFAFDAETLGEAVELIESTIQRLEDA